MTEAATAGRIGWAREESSQILAGQRVPAPSCPPACPPASHSPAPPLQEMWRSSFLHHGNRCSCFHWPGALLMLLAVLLLLACCGGQPAGRYTQPSALGGWVGGVSSCLSQHRVWACPSPVPVPTRETGNCPPQSEPGSKESLLGQLLSEAEGSGEGSVGPWVGWAAEPPAPHWPGPPRCPPLSLPATGWSW